MFSSGVLTYQALETITKNNTGQIITSSEQDNQIYINVQYHPTDAVILSLNLWFKAHTASHFQIKTYIDIAGNVLLLIFHVYEQKTQLFMGKHL